MILEAKTIKKDIINNLNKEVSKLNKKPFLVVIQVGDNPASNTYIRNKAKWLLINFSFDAGVIL